MCRGITFMVDGKMCVSVSGDEADDALASRC